VRIVSPSNGGSVSGPDVTITIEVTGTTLVPAAEATKLQDLHVHYLLDVDPTPWLDGSTPVPMGNPDIVHTAALKQTFTGVAAGPHRLTVLLGLSNHTAVQPPVAPSVSFNVDAAQAPGQLPRTGDVVDPLPWLIAFGALGIALGLILRRRRLASR
jgi:LPXTG-motif cell wall-anchored protein